jgi:hypothetical protein
VVPRVWWSKLFKVVEEWAQVRGEDGGDPSALMHYARKVPAMFVKEGKRQARVYKRLDLSQGRWFRTRVDGSRIPEKGGEQG